MYVGLYNPNAESGMKTKRRPELKPGDVCTFSNRHLKFISKVSRRQHAKARMVVLGFVGNSSEQHCMIKCATTFADKGKKQTRVYTWKRKDLWFTGYNVNRKETRILQSQYLASNKQSHLHIVSKPDVDSCTCAHNVCATGCTCGAIKPYRFTP